MSFRGGINVSRKLSAGGGASVLGNEYRSMLSSGNPPFYYRAVVFEIIFDPDLYTDEDKQTLKDSITNPEFVDSMPVNAIIAKIIDPSHQAIGQAPSIFYPFFQSHIQLPLQAGETVYVCYEDPQFQGNSLGKWITRIHESSTVEDLNYTHGDRKFDTSIDLNLIKGNPQSNYTPGFPNGTGLQDGETLSQADVDGRNGENPYDIIVNGSKAYKLGNYEVVPRFKKRPQDLVLQGMNNSLIWLGQDRVGQNKRAENEKDKRASAGVIDLVVGRGRFKISPAEDPNTTDKKTSALTIRNSRNYNEVDKTPFKKNKQNNPFEGDLSLEHDAARIYIATNSAVDENFKLKDAAGISYPDKTLKISNQANNSEHGISYIVGKADNIRIIARKKENPAIKGTILLIREGTKDEDLGYILIDENGKIQIESKEVYIGKATDKNQPYVKFIQYEETIKHLQSQIDLITQKYNQLCSTVASAFSSAVAIPYSSVASLVSGGPSVTQNGASLNSNITAKSAETPTKINNCKSTKIFGE